MVDGCKFLISCLKQSFLDVCRLAVAGDLDQIVNMFHEYDKDEPLGKVNIRVWKVNS